MIVYHGTTRRRAQRIAQVGFLPRKPSRRVWFAESVRYARGRARTQARRSRDRPVVLTCDINLNELRDRLGAKRVLIRNKVIAISASLPATVLRSHPAVDTPTTPDELAAWVNHVLGLKPHKGVGRRHPGVVRLAGWVSNRLNSQPGGRISPSEMLQVAARWLPEFFQGVTIDPGKLRVHRRYTGVDVEVRAPDIPPDRRQDEAVDCLVDPRSARRIRGLSLLAEIVDAGELFDWCVMCLADKSVTVRVAALETVLRCDGVDADVIQPFASSENKRIRAAAIAALARHGGRQAPVWFERGLKDPCTCVRLATAAQLDHLDPTTHHRLFELAIYDPNPDVARVARRLTIGKGYSKVAW